METVDTGERGRERERERREREREERESGERERERRERAERESGRQHGAFGFGSAMMAMTFRKKETRTTEVIMNS